MKAAVFKAPGRIEFQDLPIPEPSPGEVRIKVLGCGVCGTDAHIYSGEIHNAEPPVILGHEIYGRVDELSETNSGFQIGDPVVVDPFIFCGSCDSCKRGEYRFCERETFVGYHRQGGFAQYTCVPAANVYKIGVNVGAEDAVLTETLSTVLAGLTRLQPEAGRSILILGAGAVGLIWNQLLRRTLAVTLIQTELVPMRRQKAEGFGADRVLSPREQELEQEVRSLCPRGVDYLIDATGSTDAIEQSLPLLGRGGTFMSFGLCPEEERLSLSLNWFYHRQARILTSRRPPREMQRAIELLEHGKLNLSDLVTGVYPLEKIELAFDRFAGAKDQEIKMMIDPWA
ncbi:MAG: alcohol dehydrogenase catalytic domain-containing protein [Spirochaetaceae bacterium]|nr:MAG: alcohol dehydrogenase catalytic domain-containing protein [Spirochaetaceae bacterium]